MFLFNLYDILEYYYLHHCRLIIQDDSILLRPLEYRERQGLKNISLTFTPCVNVLSLIMEKITALEKSPLFFMSAW